MSQLVKPKQLKRCGNRRVVCHDHGCQMYRGDTIVISDALARKIGRPCRRCHG
jgi:hypothetical protein